jgi:hypothetical protein
MGVFQSGNRVSYLQTFDFPIQVTQQRVELFPRCPSQSEQCKITTDHPKLRANSDQRHRIPTQPNRWRSAPSRLEPKGFQNMKESYERYLVLARAEAQNGNTVAAENYYQHAEHYYRSMFSGES